MIVALVCIVLAAFALLYVLWVPREEVFVPRPPTELDHLREKKKVIYDNLKDLNFEYRTGKLSDEDYQQLKTSLQYEMAELMKAIDEQEGRTAPAAAEPAGAAAIAAAECEPGVCASCGHANPAHHRHCSECGTRLTAVLACLLLFVALTPALAQQKTDVSGVALNLTAGKPAAGLTVSLMRADRGHTTVATAKTDADGRFRFPDVEAPAPPSMLLVQAERGGVRYSQPVMSSAPVELRVYDTGAPASAIQVADRAVILQPSRGKLMVNEMYMIRNDSAPPAAYAPGGGGFRFAVPEGAERTLQVHGEGAAGMSIPLQAERDPKDKSVHTIDPVFKPGENRLEISYALDYPGSLVFEGRAVQEIQRTRLAVGPGVAVEGEGIRLIGTEPQMKFSIYDVASNERWSVRLAGESEAVAASGAGEAQGSQSEILTLESAVGRKMLWFFVALAGVLGFGFLRLWQSGQPLPAAAAGRAGATRRTKRREA